VSLYGWSVIFLKPLFSADRPLVPVLRQRLNGVRELEADTTLSMLDQADERLSALAAEGGDFRRERFLRRPASYPE
jgi:hypothetical protein